MNESFWFWFYRPFAEFIGSATLILAFAAALLLFYGVIAGLDYLQDRKSGDSNNE